MAYKAVFIVSADICGGTPPPPTAINLFLFLQKILLQNYRCYNHEKVPNESKLVYAINIHVCISSFCYPMLSYTLSYFFGNVDINVNEYLNILILN